MAGAHVEPESDQYAAGVVSPMTKAMQAGGSRTAREPAAHQRLRMSERVRTSLYLARRLHRHDFRALRTFLQRTYPEAAWVRRAGLFLTWLHGQCWDAIPRVLRTTSFAKLVSDTPIWLTDQNPLAGHPWSGNPEASASGACGGGSDRRGLHWRLAGVPLGEVRRTRVDGGRGHGRSRVRSVGPECRRSGNGTLLRDGVCDSPQALDARSSGSFAIGDGSHVAPVRGGLLPGRLQERGPGGTDDPRRRVCLRLCARRLGARAPG